MTRVSLFASAVALAGLAVASGAGEATASGAPYCIQQFGINGAATGACMYFNLQECQEAAARTRGNCVGNVDYRGEPSRSSPRQRRGW